MPEHKTSSCPYAVSVSDEEDNGDSQVGELLEAALTSCPAFQEGCCPFKDSKSADQVRLALLDLPPSHLQEQGHFYRALSHLHHVSQTMEDDKEKFAISGGCPVQSYARDASFAQAMEEYSLASIMARMAQDLEDKEDEDELSDEVMNERKTLQPPLLSMLDNRAEQTSDQVCLSEALKTGTAVSHQAAEDVHFVKNFIKGAIDRTLYGELVLSLYHVYVHLEEALDKHAPLHFSSCHFPHELSRREALEEDVDFWHGSLPKRFSAATQDYVDRIKYLSRTDPLLLLAHAYTRYLGDLSGGKILARVARKAMQLDKDGLDFYRFDNIPSAKAFKDQYRQALDDLQLEPIEVSKLVAEANVAFVLNMRLFEELDVAANIEGAQVRDLKEALAFANAVTSPGTAAQGNDDDTKKECPFAKLGSAVSPHKTTISASRLKVPWPLVAGLLLSVLWWGLQTFCLADNNGDSSSIESRSPRSMADILLMPLEQWDLDGPWT